VFDMSWQAKLIFSGRDRVRWLNGMVTNNVRDLALGHGVYSFILTPQGHNQGDLVAYNRGDYLLVATDREQAPKITALLQRYIIMDDVEIEDISDKLGAIGVAGPKAGEVLSSAGIDVSQLQAGQVIDTVGARSAFRLRAIPIRGWMATRSGSPRSMPTEFGMR
jgi:glycine cleavage system aminomethyltransferase T